MQIESIFMIAVIDYKAGNLTSVRLAFETLGLNAEITSSSRKILSADHVVFPGVGAARSAMRTLEQLELVDTIKQVFHNGIPFMGICVGLQILLDRSEEDDGVDTIGLIPGMVKLFSPADPFDKVPQIGWNSVALRYSHPVFNGISDNSNFYFVHSYYPMPSDNSDILGQTEYAGATFSSVIARNNLVATQFHPEKSGRIGLQLLDNFSKWNGN